MSFSFTLPPDEPDGVPSINALPEVSTIPEDVPGGEVGVDAYVAPEALPDLPVIMNVGATGDPKILHVSVSKHTVWPKSFGDPGGEKNKGSAQQYQLLTSYWSIKPKTPIFAPASVVYVRPIWFADYNASGPHGIEVHISNALTPAGTYVIEIDSPADNFDRAWKSSASFVVRADPNRVTPLIGGESSGKILPAVLRSFGAAVEGMIGRPSTRTTELLNNESTSVNVETTAHFPETGEVFIGGVKFSYTGKGGLGGAKLTGLSSEEYVAPIPKNTEVVLHVASILPD